MSDEPKLPPGFQPDNTVPKPPKGFSPEDPVKKKEPSVLGVPSSLAFTVGANPSDVEAPSISLRPATKNSKETRPLFPAQKDIQVNAGDFDNDPIGVTFDAMRQGATDPLKEFGRSQRNVAASTGRAQDPSIQKTIQQDESNKKGKEAAPRFSLKEVNLAVKEVREQFEKNTDNSVAHLMKRSGINNPDAIYSDEANETIKKSLQPGNTTDLVAYDRLQQARDARKAIQAGGSLEDIVVNFVAKTNPDAAKYIKELQATGESFHSNIGDILSGKPATEVKKDAAHSLGNATMGDYVYEAFNNSAFMEEAAKNPALATQIQNEAPQLINKYPSAGRKIVGQLISQKMEDMGINNSIVNVVTKKEADKAVAALLEEGKFTDNEKKFYEENIRPNLGLTNFGKALMGNPLVRTPGVVENAIEGFTTGVGEYLGTVSTDPQQALKETLEDQHRGIFVKPKNIAHEITSEGGRLIGQSLSMYGGGRLLQGVGAIKNIDKAVSAASGVQAYSSYKKQSQLLFPGEKAKQEGFSLAMALTEVLTEGIFKDRKVVEGLMSKMKTPVSTIIRDFSANKITREAAENSLSRAIKTAIEAGKYTVKGMGENTLEEYSTEVASQALEGALKNKSISEWFDAEKQWNTIRQAFLGSTFIGGLAARADMAKNKGVTARTIYEMAENPEYWKIKMQQEADKDPELAELLPDRLQNLDYASKVYNDMQGTGMDEKQKVKFFITELEKKVAQDKADTKTSQALKNKELEVVKDADKVQQDLLEGKDDGSIEGDEKFQEPTLEDKAIDIVTQHADKLGMYGEVVKQDPSAALGVAKMIAQQAQGYSDNWEKVGGGRESDMVEQGYPQELIDVAKELFPAPKEETVVDEVSQPVELDPTLPEGYELPQQPTTSSEVNIPKNEKAETNEGELEESTQSNEPVTPEEGSQSEGGTTEPPPPPTKEKVGSIYVESPGVELTYKGLQDVANRFDLRDVDPREHKSDLQLLTDAKVTTDKWVEKGEYQKNIDKLIVDAESGSVLTDEQQVILERHLAALSIAAEKLDIKSKEFDVIHQKIARIKEAGETTRGEAGAALRKRTQRLVPKTIMDEVLAEAESAGVATLTDAQKEIVQREYENEKKIQDELNEKIAKLEEENAKLKAGEKISEERKRSRKGKKTTQEFKDEREKLIEDIKEKLKKSREDTSATILPFAKELIAISPEVTKMVKSYIEQGITELADIVDKVAEVLSVEIPGIEKKDIHNLIAGEYNEKKPTRNQLAAQLKDLKDEAKLINQLEALEQGQEPKSESKKIERNRKIKELQDKIKNHDVSKLATAKKSIRTQIEKIEKQIESGNFSTPEKAPKVKLDKEGLALQQKLINLKRDREVRRLKNEYAKRTLWEKGRDKVAELFNIPRSIMASTDFSAPLNQAIVATMAYPDLARKALLQMFKSSVSQSAFDRWFYELKEDPRYDLMKELKLKISDPHSPFLTAKEEAFMSGYAEQIPIAGAFIKGSERAYVQYLNHMRVDLFNRFITRFEEKGKTYENSKKLYEKTARYINNITGAGNLGKLEEWTPFLSGLLFSPRLMASRINLLNPVYFATLPKELKAAYGKDMGVFFGLTSTIVTLFSLYGKYVQDDDDEDKITVETDPRSSDFGKIRQGNTRYNPWGGFQPYVTLASRQFSGKTKSTTTDVLQELDSDAPFGRDRGKVALDFLRGKLAPVPSSFVDLLQGENTVGEKATLLGEVKESVTPLSIGGIIDAWKDKGWVSAVSVGMPAIFGIGTQTYGERKQNIPDKIRINDKQVELTKEQKDYLTKFVEEKTDKDIKKLKTIPEYKAMDKEGQRSLESLVKRNSLSAGKEATQKKFRAEWPKETPEERRQKKKEELEVKRILSKIK